MKSFLLMQRCNVFMFPSFYTNIQPPPPPAEKSSSSNFHRNFTDNIRYPREIYCTIKKREKLLPKQKQKQKPHFKQIALATNPKTHLKTNEFQFKTPSLIHNENRNPPLNFFRRRNSWQFK